MGGRARSVALGLVVLLGVGAVAAQPPSERPIGQIVGIVGDTLAVFDGPKSKTKELFRRADLTFPIPVYEQAPNMRVRIALPGGRRGWVDKMAVQIEERSSAPFPCDAPPSKQVAAAGTRGLDPGCRR